MPSLWTKVSQSTSYLLWLERETQILRFSDFLVWNNSAIWLSPEDKYLLSQILHKLSSYQDIPTASGLKIHLLVYTWQPILAWNCCAFQKTSASCYRIWPTGRFHWVNPELLFARVWSFLRSDWHKSIFTPAVISQQELHQGSRAKIVQSALENSPSMPISNSVWLCWDVWWTFSCVWVWYPSLWNIF